MGYQSSAPSIIVILANMICALSTKRENVRSNLVAAKLSLSAAEIEAISGLDRNHRVANPDFAPNWD